MHDTYRRGDPYRICDRCGFRKRRSETRKEYTGLIVCGPCYDPRHPQEFVRGVKDKQSFPDPRPEPADTFVGPGDITWDDL